MRWLIQVAVMMLTGVANAEEPKPFLVVASGDQQVVVDVRAVAPDRNDHQRTINQPAAKGVVAPWGSRLAFTAETPGGGAPAVFVQDLAPAAQGDAPHQAGPPVAGLELIGWVGRGRVLVSDRADAAGSMLRIVDARLPRDSTFGESVNVTTEPGVYRLATINHAGEIAYLAVRGADAGDILVYSGGVTTELAKGVEAKSVCWSPDGRKLAVARPGSVTLYDRNGGKPVVYQLPGAKDGEPARINSMAWRPDDLAIALLPDWPKPDHPPGNPRVWSLDVRTGECTVIAQLVTSATSLRWLPDTGCTTTLDEACAMAKAPVRAQRP